MSLADELKEKTQKARKESKRKRMKDRNEEDGKQRTDISQCVEKIMKDLPGLMNNAAENERNEFQILRLFEKHLRGITLYELQDNLAYYNKEHRMRTILEFPIDKILDYLKKNEIGFKIIKVDQSDPKEGLYCEDLFLVAYW